VKPLQQQPADRMWLGNCVHEAERAYKRALAAGMNARAALLLGHIASFKDCWAFRKLLARMLRVSVRTIQRWLTKAKSLGLIEVYRGKKNETPPNADGPIPCGWSHRFTSGWGKAGDDVKNAIHQARLKWVARAAIVFSNVPLPQKSAKAAMPSLTPGAPRASRYKGISSDGILAELDRIDGQSPRDGPE
jgi:hypothetical protein